MIEVRLFASLAGESAKGPGELRVEARPGLTVAEVISEAGIENNELYVVVINGNGANLESVLVDGDRVGLFPPMSGG